MKIVAFELKGAPHLGVVEGDQVIDLQAADPKLPADLRTVLEQNKGNQCKAAKQLGMHRNTLSRTITELELDIRPLRKSQTSAKEGRRPPRSALLMMEKKASR